MTSKHRLTVTTLLLVILALPLAAQNTAPAAQTPSSTEVSPDARTAKDLSQTKEDLAKMRVILNQMRTNLAFVGNTTTPLAHQFQLDIDMWQALLDHMEHRADTKPSKENPR
jgi:hypothetical protein